MSKEQIKLALFLKKVPGRGNNIPSLGYYLFKDLADITLNDNGYPISIIYSAYYHPTEPDFSAGCLITVQAISLFKTQSDGPKENGYDIRNKVILIKELSLEDGDYHGTPYKRYKAVWEIIDFINADEIEDEVLLKEISDTEDILLIDEESELVFWETNQAEYYMTQGEIENLLDELERQNRENPEE